MAPIGRRRPDRVPRPRGVAAPSPAGLRPRRSRAAHAGRVDQRDPVGDPRCHDRRGGGVRRGRRGQGRRLRRHPRAGPPARRSARVFDTILDEQSILGLALGAGLTGLIPIPEIQYLAYLHNAEDQLRGEAATLPFFCQGRFTNPMVVRIAGLAYQKGFGGHFHNDNAVGRAARHPGVVVGCPVGGDDAAAMLRTLVAAAAERRDRLGVPRADRALPPARSARAGRRWLARWR